MSNPLYAKVHALLLEDPRLHHAAARLAAEFRVPEDFAVMATLGILAAIDLWLVSRGQAGEDGLLPGDGYATVRQSAMVSPQLARAATKALQEEGFLEQAGDVTRRVGFAEAYADLIGARVYQRNRRAGRGLGRRSTGRRRVADASPTGRGSSGKTRGEKSEPLTAVASESRVPETAVDVGVASREAAAAGSPPAPGANGTAPGREGPCRRCVDGLVVRKGGRPVCCDCRRGRDRSRSMAKAARDEEASARRAASAMAAGRAGRRGGEAVSLQDLVPSLRASIPVPGEPPARAGPDRGSGTGSPLPDP